MKTCQTCGVRKLENTDHFCRLEPLLLDSICRRCRRREHKVAPDPPEMTEERMRSAQERYLKNIEIREARNIRRRDAIRNDPVLREEANRKNREHTRKCNYIGGSR